MLLLSYIAGFAVITLLAHHFVRPRAVAFLVALLLSLAVSVFAGWMQRGAVALWIIGVVVLMFTAACSVLGASFIYYGVAAAYRRAKLRR